MPDEEGTEGLDGVLEEDLEAVGGDVEMTAGLEVFLGAVQSAAKGVGGGSTHAHGDHVEVQVAVGEMMKV